MDPKDLEKAEILEEVRKEFEGLKSDIRQKTMGYVLIALGLIAGLAWNDAIKALIDQLYPSSSDTLTAKFLYATIVTVVIIILIRILTKAIRKEH